jgi:hypothetical protein
VGEKSRRHARDGWPQNPDLDAPATLSRIGPRHDPLSRASPGYMYSQKCPWSRRSIRSWPHHPFCAEVPGRARFRRSEGGWVTCLVLGLLRSVAWPFLPNKRWLGAHYVRIGWGWVGSRSPGVASRLRSLRTGESESQDTRSGHNPSKCRIYKMELTPYYFPFFCEQYYSPSF